MAIMVMAEAGFVVADRLLDVGTEMSKQGPNMNHEVLNQSILQVMRTEISLHSSI